MSPRASALTLLVVSGFVGCSRQPATPPSPDSSATSDASPMPVASTASTASRASDAAAPESTATIGLAGGTYRAEGVTMIVPPDALKSARKFKISKVTGAALADWPRGTELGFVFEPANERFRIPVLIKLPHPDGDGEVVCQNGPGERLQFEFEWKPGHRFPVTVSELPQRCAVYSLEHAKALKAVRDREAAQVQKTNKTFNGEIKGKSCNPHELVRSNAGKDLREPPGVGGCPAGMAPVTGKPRVCIDRWEAHLVELLDDGTEHTWSPYFNPGPLRVPAKSAPGAIPQAYVSQVQSGAACTAASKRLCKDDERVAACRSRNA